MTPITTGYMTVMLIVMLVLTMLISATVYETRKLGEVLSEMNARQKTVVVTQHKAIEEKIDAVCKH